MVDPHRLAELRSLAFHRAAGTIADDDDRDPSTAAVQAERAERGVPPQRLATVDVADELQTAAAGRVRRAFDEP